MADDRSSRCRNEGNRRMVHGHPRTGLHTVNRRTIESIIDNTLLLYTATTNTAVLNPA